MSTGKLLKRIKEIGSNSSTTLQDVILKCQEELGEVSAEDLRARNIKPKKDNQDPVQERKEESVDLLLSTLDLCLRQMSEAEIKKILTNKTNKWASYVK